MLEEAWVWSCCDRITVAFEIDSLFTAITSSQNYPTLVTSTLWSSTPKVAYLSIDNGVGGEGGVYY